MKQLLYLLLICLFCLNISTFTQNPEWINYTNGDNITAVKMEGELIWIGTSGGLVQINNTSGNTLYYNKLNSGLPDNSITCIAIDKSGNKWIGTEKGFVKYDGTLWTVYNTLNSELSTNTINCIAIDESDNKWIGTGSESRMMPGGGLIKFDGTDWTVYNTSNSGISTNTINCIAIDKFGTKWIGTAPEYNETNFNLIMDGGVVKFDDTTWTVYNRSNSGLRMNEVNSIAIDEYGNKWIGTPERSLDGTIEGGGLVKFDDTTWSVYDTLNSGLPSNDVICIEIDETGNKWIGTWEGLAKFDNTTWTLYNTSNSELLSNPIFHITIDVLGNKWIGTMTSSGTTGGLVKFDDTNWTKINTSNTGLPSNTIVDIAIDYTGNKWIGTYNGLAKFDGTDWVVYNESNSGLPNNNIIDIEIDNASNMWVLTEEGLTKFDNTDWTVYNNPISSLPSYSINCLAIDKTNNKWIGTREGLFKFDDINWTLYDTLNSGLPSNDVWCIEIDEFDNKWIGTCKYAWGPWGGKGLVKFDNTTWSIYNTSNSDLPSNTIVDIAIDYTGNKWILTGCGLAKFDDATWSVYSDQCADYWCLAIDESGNKFIGMSAHTYPAAFGILKFDDEDWTTYDTDHSGIPSNHVSCISVDDFNNKWIGTSEGLAVFNENGVVTDLDRQEQIDEIIPKEFALFQNYPNPFNPSTTLKYEIPKESYITLKVYDILGREVATLVNKQQKAGYYEVDWNAANNSSGIYFYRIQAGDFVETKKMVLMK